MKFQAWWKNWPRWAPVVLLVCLLLQAGLAVRQQSLSWDEGDHLYSGYCNWTRGEYSLNPEHPPLAKLVAALPLLQLHLKLAPRQGRYFKTEAYWGGTAMIFHNGVYSADTVLLRARLAMLVFASGLALMLFFAGREMFGAWAGLIAMVLYVFDTNVLAHAPLITTDTAGSCGFFAAIYALYRWAKRPTWGRLLLAGLAAGFALVSKHSAVLLVPMVLTLLAGEVAGRAWSRRPGCEWGEAENAGSAGRDALRIAGALVVLVAVAAAVMWAVYGFRFAMRPDGVVLPDVHPQAMKLGTVSGGVILWLLAHHLLPESYLYGLVDVFQVGDTWPAYLFGRVSEHGVWYFFPAALSMKWTLAFLVLLAIGLFALVTGRVGRKREVWFVAVPAVIYLAVAISSPLAIGVRHVLPSFAFVFLLAAAGAAALAVRDRRWAYAVAVLLAWHAADSLRMFPHYFGYSNALWGGPSQTWRYVADSTVDWGQQLKAVKQYTDEHHIDHCYFAYFIAPFVVPRDYGVPCDLLPTFDTNVSDSMVDVPETITGPVFLNTSDLTGYEFGTSALNPYQELVGRQPDDLIAGGVAVFHGSFRFPLARSMNAEIHARNLLKTRDFARALVAVNEALAIAPESFTANLEAGDALTALGRKGEAEARFRTAQAVVDARMEPSAQAVWRPELAKRMAAVR